MQAGASLDAAEARAAQHPDQLTVLSPQMAESEVELKPAERYREEAWSQGETRVAEVQWLSTHIAGREKQLAHVTQII